MQSTRDAFIVNGNKISVFDHALPQEGIAISNLRHDEGIGFLG
jgi:hypothetical protein